MNDTNAKVFKIQDGFGTTRSHQTADCPGAALSQYAVSVNVPSEMLIKAGWSAVEVSHGTH